MTKDTQDTQGKELSEWQKRNKEYLEQKAQKEAEEEKERAEKQRQRQEQLHLKTESSQESEEREESDEAAEEAEGETEEELEWEVLSEEAAESDEELSEKELKKRLREQKKAEKQADRPPIERIHIYRALPILAVSGLLFLASLYFLSPLSTMKEIQLSGNRLVSEESLLRSSKIDSRDYTLTTFLNQGNHIRNFQSASPWIEQVSMTYQFPITFKVDVKEYGILAYLQEDGRYYPILTNGEVIREEVAASALPDDRMTVEFSDAELIRTLVRQLESVPDSVKNDIVTVQLTPSRVTGDLATLTMNDGNRIFVPISHIAKKLPYYSGIRSQLEVPSIVDMEAGIFSYAEGAENEAENAGDSAENSEENAQERAEDDTEQTEQGTETEESADENPEITENN